MVWRGGVLWAAKGADGKYRQVPGVGTYDRADELARSLGLARWGGPGHNRGPAIFRGVVPELPVDNRIAVAMVPLTVPSASAPGHEDRMRRLDMRLHFGLSLTGEGHVGYLSDDGSACWCCGAVPPVSTWVAKHGWHVREIMTGCHRAKEMYCPDCFAEWGWPDGGETG
jgi:hypothetical protein